VRHPRTGRRAPEGPEWTITRVTMLPKSCIGIDLIFGVLFGKAAVPAAFMAAFFAGKHYF
jgi:hypothetical protein